jgi:hypothetical protein
LIRAARKGVALFSTGGRSLCLRAATAGRSAHHQFSDSQQTMVRAGECQLSAGRPAQKVKWQKRSLVGV